MLIMRLLGKFEVEPTLRNRRGLRASEYYRNTVSEDQQDPDIWAELLRRESLREKEIAEYRAAKKKHREDLARKAAEERAERLLREERTRRHQERIDKKQQAQLKES
jgi:hypothetical protein